MSEIRPAQPRTSAQISLPDGRCFEGPIGTSLEHYIRAAFPQPAIPIVAALVDGRLRELTFPITEDVKVVPLDIADTEGARIYRRSLVYLMLAAAHRLDPSLRLYVDHSLPFGAYFCQVRGRAPFSDAEIVALEAEMRRLVEADLPILREMVTVEQALEIYAAREATDKVALLRYRRVNQKPLLRMYRLEDYADYLHGYMVPATGYLKYFRLMPWGEGFLLRFPRRHKPTEILPIVPSPQFMQVFREYGHWLQHLAIENVSDLNAAIERGKLQQIILVSEALHEHKISEIAAQIVARFRAQGTRIVLIAGPSSSGKTTFSRRLAVQLLAQGLTPFPLELDNYFVDREKTPRDENGDYDFEALEALDLDLLNTQLADLLTGKQVQLPRFNFQLGRREPGKIVRLGPQHILIAEGIHGLNPDLVPGLPAQAAFRIYISALTQLNLDSHNRISTTDSRLLRRIVRDARTRGYTAADTIARWESVRRGEKRHIFPHQENADVMFNSALAYELSVLKPFVEPLLLQVDPHSLERIEAKRLLTFLEWFVPARPDLVPENSILREFIGGSSLEDFHWEE